MNALTCFTAWSATAFLAMAPLTVGAAPRAPGQPLHMSGRVVTPDGKPAADATITFDIVNLQTHTALISQTATPDGNGAFDITVAPDRMKAAFRTKSGPILSAALILYVVSPDGVTVCSPPMGDTRRTIRLQPFTSLRVRLLDEDGRPVAHVRLVPQYFISDHKFVRWDSSVADLWTQVTDAAGMATFPRLPQGNMTLIDVGDERYASSDYRSSITLAQDKITPDQTLHVVRGGSLAGRVLYGLTKTPAADVFVAAMQTGDSAGMGEAKTDKDGRYRITRLTPGAYNVEISLRPALAAQWTAVARAVTVRAGGSQAGLDFSLVHGALLTGRVTDKSTGKPVAGAAVGATGPAQPSNSRGSGAAVTGPDGVYRLRVPAGLQQVSASGLPSALEDDRAGPD